MSLFRVEINSLPLFNPEIGKLPLAVLFANMSETLKLLTKAVVNTTINERDTEKMLAFFQKMHDDSREKGSADYRVHCDTFIVFVTKAYNSVLADFLRELN